MHICTNFTHLFYIEHSEIYANKMTRSNNSIVGTVCLNSFAPDFLKLRWITSSPGGCTLAEKPSSPLPTFETSTFVGIACNETITVKRKTNRAFIFVKFLTHKIIGKPLKSAYKVKQVSFNLRYLFNPRFKLSMTQMVDEFNLSINKFQLLWI